MRLDGWGGCFIISACLGLQTLLFTHESWFLRQRVAITARRSLYFFMNPDSSRKTFFRQSGWLVLCTVLSGLAFYAVHFFSKRIPDSEYAIFGTLLAVLNCLCIPALGLQMVFAQQTAAAITEQDRHRLARTAHGVLVGCFVIWMVVSLVVFVFRQSIITGWKLSNPIALWLMLLVALASLWLPVFTGLLQGRQNFLWVGWALILNSVGRVGVVAVIVIVYSGYAAGMTGGILIGILATLAVSSWTSRELWLVRGVAIDWKAWLVRVVPLTLGFGAFQFMFSVDPLYVQWLFDSDRTASYIMAGTLGRALCTFTIPVVAVMFPKIVRSAALSEKSNVLGMTLMITGGLVGIGALGLAVVAPWILPLVGKADFVEAVPLLRWFALSMTPLAIANVLLNDLLARNRFKLVPWLVVIAVTYGVVLTQFRPGAAPFTSRHIKDIPLLVAELRQPTNQISLFVADQLSPKTRQLVATFSETSDRGAVAQALANELNRLRSGLCIYDPERFSTIKLQKQTANLLNRQPEGADLVRLNRMLLEDAFPKALDDPSYARIIETLGVFNVLFLLVVAGFRWKDGRTR